MEFKPDQGIKYDSKVWNYYKERLSRELDEYALDTDDLSRNAMMREFIVNYAEKEIKNEKRDRELKLQGISIKLANVVVETKNGTRQFPVINEYDGHYMLRTRYFKLVGSTIEIGTVDVLPKSILISN